MAEVRPFNRPAADMQPGLSLHTFSSSLFSRYYGVARETHGGSNRVDPRPSLLRLWTADTGKRTVVVGG